jgi:hypothetical protein
MNIATNRPISQIAFQSKPLEELFARPLLSEKPTVELIHLDQHQRLGVFGKGVAMVVCRY